MAYTPATADILQSTFPKFADVDDAVVETWITQARRMVDSSWCEDDRQMGEMLLAAHYMTLEGLGAGTEAQLAAEGMSDFRSVRSGSFSFTRADSADQDAAGTIMSTTYGRRFADLAQSNRGGARVTNSGSLPDGVEGLDPFYWSA